MCGFYGLLRGGGRKRRTFNHRSSNTCAKILHIYGKSEETRFSRYFTKMGTILVTPLPYGTWKTMLRLVSTDLDYLIGIFDWGYSTMWKFSNFSWYSDFTWNLFWLISEDQQVLFEQVWWLWILIFGKIPHLKMSMTLKNFKIQSCSNGQNGSFLGLQMTKIDFTWKTEWQKSSEISTLCILILAAQVCTLRNCKHSTISNAWFYYIFRILVVV